jgi:hypothetical protein
MTSEFSLLSLPKLQTLLSCSISFNDGFQKGVFVGFICSPSSTTQNHKILYVHFLIYLTGKKIGVKYYCVGLTSWPLRCGYFGLQMKYETSSELKNLVNLTR